MAENEDGLRLLSRISARLVGIESADLDANVEDCLRELALFVGADRSSLFRFGGDPTMASNTHEWCADPADSQRALLQEFPAERFGYYWEQLRQKKTVSVGRLADLPRQAVGEHAWIAEHGFRALLFTPIVVHDRLVGALGFYGAVGQDRVWSAQVRLLLEIVGDLFHSAIVAHQASAALRESESIYRTLVDTCPDAIALTAMDGTIVKANARALEIYGVDTTEQLVGRSAFDLVAPEDRDRARANIQRRGRANDPGSVSYLLQRADGETFPGELSASPVFDDSGRPWGVVAVVRDVSDRVRMESKLQQTGRLASLGTLAAGLAHEVNNPLTYVLISLQRLTRLLPMLDGVPEPQLQTLLDSANAASEGIDRIAAIVRDLRTFSHSDTDEINSCQIEQLIDHTLTLAAHQFRTRAPIVRDYGETPTIQVNAGRLSQVFLNLLINAAHAVAPGDYDNNEVRIRTRSENGEVIVEISDSGCGIAPEARGRLFDPFFTTKPVGVGSGLGLSICSGIVAAHEGTIEVDSTLGEGSTFRVRIPIRARIGGARSTQAPMEVGEAVPSSRILVVDDEPMICSVVEGILSKDHEIKSVHSGREAIGALENAPFDLVVCDLMMPDLSGPDLYSWASERAPDVAGRMIFITGAAAHPSMREFVAAHRHRLLEKPFDPSELRALVSALLA